MNIIVATLHDWNIANYRDLKKSYPQHSWHLITKKQDLTLKQIQRINPDYIFFPHWSWIIPESIYAHYTCIVFHMTDLPYGRGGTPLQNLIIRGHTTTKISALRVDGGIDTGDIYLKRSLSLLGSAHEIYLRLSRIVFMSMIPYLLRNNARPRKQRGKIVQFKRRSPEQSKLPIRATNRKLYDFIRMLDAPGYPKAYLDTSSKRIEFTNAHLYKNILSAHVQIYEKK